MSTVPPARKRRLKWTCRYCGHTFTTWTRRGLRVTCRNPKCGRVQEGPAGIELMAARLDQLQPTRKVATELKVVTSPAKRLPTTSKRRAAAARAVAPAASRGRPAAPPTAAPPAQPPVPASAPSLGERIGRVLFAGGKA